MAPKLYLKAARAKARERPKRARARKARKGKEFIQWDTGSCCIIRLSC